MRECIFCRIVSGKEKSVKIRENDEFLAILDLYPNTKGMTTILTKKHYSSYLFDMSVKAYTRFMKFSRDTAKFLDVGLGVKRTSLVIEGMGIDHAHIKLYPMHKLEKMFISEHDKKRVFSKKFKKEPVFFEKYEGYITTLLGKKADFEELKKIKKEVEKNVKRKL